MQRYGVHRLGMSLLASALPPDPDHAIPELHGDGDFPGPTDPPQGCHFHPRCPPARAVCRGTAPALRAVGGAEVACRLYGNGSPPSFVATSGPQ